MYPGPYETPEYLDYPFPSGGGCPTIKAVLRDGEVKGPGYGGSGCGGGTGINCNDTYLYILHHTETIKNTIYYTNKASVPNSWGNQQTISTRRNCTDANAEDYEIYHNLELDAQYNEYTDAIQNPDNTWNYTYNLYKTTMYFKVVGDYDVCPPGTEYNPYTGTCDVLPGWSWDGNGYVKDPPVYPGIPDGPILNPPTCLPVDPATPGVCPDCYEYDSIQDVCIYVGGEGCEEEPPCVVTAGCDAKPITGECIDRGDC